MRAWMFADSANGVPLGPVPPGEVTGAVGAELGGVLLLLSELCDDTFIARTEASNSRVSS